MKAKKHHKEETVEPVDFGGNHEAAEEGEVIDPAETEAAESTENPQPEPEVIDASEDRRYQDLLNQYQRTLAEFDNFRKRTNKEKAGMYEDGVRDTVEKLLPVIDNFERALNAGEDKDNKFYQGIVMIARQFSAFLTELGVTPIPAAPGDPFNHNLHFAVAHMEDEQYGNNEIVDELQKGYKLKDKIIRPSMVRVAN